MSKLKRDIRFTLIVKFLLLISLWIVCFKGAVKNTVSMQQWLYGSSTDVAGNTQKLEGKHDSRH